MSNLTDFKIHCIALTKNEEDVVAECLLEAAKWADFIYVYDGASTDRTWEIVNSLKNSRIIPWKQDGKVFKEGLRAEVFNAFRDRASDGDWWLQLNVDEFYPESPRSFFRRVPRGFDAVWGITVEYYVTWKDVASLNFARPFGQVMPELKYYKVPWSELRAFRYRKRLVWSSDWAWPRHVGVAANERIILKHYPYRSPQQIQMRLNIRRDNRERGFSGWDHAKQDTWQEKILNHEDCKVDDCSGRFQIDELRIPTHLEPRWRRLLKRFAHTTRIWP